MGAPARGFTAAGGFKERGVIYFAIGAVAFCDAIAYPVWCICKGIVRAIVGSPDPFKK